VTHEDFASPAGAQKVSPGQTDAVPDFIRQLPAAAAGDIAVFDADGTLWVDDVADDFTTWMMEQGEISADRWPTYMRIYRDHPPTGCRYLLTFYTGMSLAKLEQDVGRWWSTEADRKWVTEAVEALHLLHRRGYAIWIVSGTPTNFLAPLARLLPIDHVVGMDFELDEQRRITGRHAGIACAGTGKAEKLMALASGRRIRFCAGNGTLDGPMMELADVAWSVYPAPDFAEYSRARGWAILPRPPDFVEEEKFR
jgi:HAD superfamily phosphoserine phosphatase-like hydrolase